MLGSGKEEEKDKDGDSAEPADDIAFLAAAEPILSLTLGCDIDSADDDRGRAPRIIQQLIKFSISLRRSICFQVDEFVSAASSSDYSSDSSR
ncbi:hypothetical protein BC938DRAFT_478939 [Jimgerdemannia flammicorona]|uniref:Uncharacterized protein n=1 Tax=Jimgerdemannia flammicorona TaxID=994334 RepID=A0A433QLZ9_9FUNG|nr:hypothetical protein BC938DRAFT_478939 [Jimgerdemannia flammicorona]